MHGPWFRTFCMVPGTMVENILENKISCFLQSLYPLFSVVSGLNSWRGLPLFPSDLEVNLISMCLLNVSDYTLDNSFCPFRYVIVRLENCTNPFCGVCFLMWTRLFCLNYYMFSYAAGFPVIFRYVKVPIFTLGTRFQGSYLLVSLYLDRHGWRIFPWTEDNLFSTPTMAISPKTFYPNNPLLS